MRIVLEKKIARMIPTDSPGVDISVLSTQSGIPEIRLLPLLRQLTAVNIFRETSPRQFAHTTTSATLSRPEFSNMADLLIHFLDEGFKSAGFLPESLDAYSAKFDTVMKSDLRTAFNMAYGTDAHYFDWIYAPENVAKYGERFGRSMMGGAREEQIDPTLDSYPWGRFRDGDVLIDVGGGIGHVGVGVAKRVQKGVKVIVQDFPSVVVQGRQIHGHLVDFQPHNFFEEQPVKNAQVYYLRLILHDWPDEVAKDILRNIIPAMGPGSKLLVIDTIWREDDYWVSGKDDKEIIERWDGGKRAINVRTLHMLNKLGMPGGTSG
jgi:O-methyltransferase domain